MLISSDLLVLELDRLSSPVETPSWRSVEVFESIARLGLVRRPVLLVVAFYALRDRGVSTHDEVVIMFVVVHRGLSLARHYEIVRLLASNQLVHQVWCDGRVQLGYTHWRAYIRLDSAHFMGCSGCDARIQVELLHGRFYVNGLVDASLVRYAVTR